MARALRLLRRFGPYLLALALGLAGQGARGLFEPDEGRNVHIALGMLATGDWLVPRLDGLPYLDKPPLAFWPIAASLALFGTHELAARLPLALAWVGTCAAIAMAGRSLWDRATGRLAATLYALCLAPFAAANVITPDAFLALWVALLYALVLRAADEERLGLWLLAGVVAGAGALTKGTALLVFAAPLALALAVRRRGLRWLAAPGPWVGALAALALGLSWYVGIARRLPGAAEYFLSNQVTGRLLDSSYHRNGEGSKLLTLYLPTLVAGAAPASIWWLAQGRRLWRVHRESGRRLSRAGWFVALTFVLPLAVLCAARSRLPLYLLPLFAPVALATARAIEAHGLAANPSSARRIRTAAVAWAALLVVLKLSSALVPSPRDGRRLADAVERAGRAGGGAGVSVWAVDTTLHGLRFYRDGPVQWSTTRTERYPMYAPVPGLAAQLTELHPDRALIVTPATSRDRVAAATGALGYVCADRPAPRPLLILDCSGALEVAHDATAGGRGLAARRDS